MHFLQLVTQCASTDIQRSHYQFIFKLPLEMQYRPHRYSTSASPYVPSEFPSNGYLEISSTTLSSRFQKEFEDLLAKCRENLHCLRLTQECLNVFVRE